MPGWCGPRPLPAARLAANLPGMGKWSGLGLLIAVRTIMGVQFQSVGALGPLLVGTLVADFAALGSLIGAYQLPGAAVSLPGGVLSARLGDKRVLLAGLALMALGMAVMALAPGVALALLGRVLAGCGGALLNLVLSKLVMDRFDGRSLPLAMGGMLMAWPLGLTLGLAVVPPLALGLGWRGAFWLLAGLAALAMLAVPLLRPDGPQPHQAGAAARPPNWPALLAAVLGWSSFNIGLVLVLSFAPALLVARGLAAPEAGQLASLTGWALVVLTPLGGYLAGRHGRGSGQILLGAALAVPLAEALAWLPPGEWAAVAYLGYGLATGLMAAPLISLPAQVLPPPARAFGMGAFYSLYYLGMALVPPFAGWARDASGDPAAPLHLAAGLLVVAGLAVPLFDRLARAKVSGG